MATRKTGAAKRAKTAKADTPPTAAADSTADDQLPLEGDGAADTPAGVGTSAAPVEALADETPAETNDASAGDSDSVDEAEPDVPAAPALAPVAFAGGVGRYRVVATGAEIRLANGRAADRVAAGELERI